MLGRIGCRTANAPFSLIGRLSRDRFREVLLAGTRRGPEMARNVTLAAVAIVGLALLGCAAIYATAKPYQQDRILITLGFKSV
jgi:hypothetical protein